MSRPIVYKGPLMRLCRPLRQPRRLPRTKALRVSIFVSEHRVVTRLGLLVRARRLRFECWRVRVSGLAG
jgi:hypothetical protein